MDVEIDHIPLNIVGISYKSDGNWAVYRSKDDKYTVRLEIGRNLLVGQVPQCAELQVRKEV